MANGKIATRIAEKIAKTIGEEKDGASLAIERLLYERSARTGDQIGEVVRAFAPIISTEIEPLMKVLGVAFRTSVSSNFTDGVAICRKCKGRSETLNVRGIIHKPNCWISRAQKLIDEEK